ncbi:pleckstrin homology domain-containing family A member 7 [Corythoichthys intestinalis]|uniref:pleckstrin homology domain-containing family A member 7 n=1 Tax=Corythoichthys intestinalis TaxID=161448 RepID=UPI0025A5982D|nr:pleckstrin homology domain-containing family A member 7 [Corythoichthys intestinalis]XP_057682186.1 pleckstrin homology domain-containing family A member 7 [Corythoichthys intestinalis]
MEDQDRLSQASSVATISYFPVRRESDGKLHAFGKRCQSAKRDPNCPVVIRGWLSKKDSTGLKLWKRRWFVLSNYCLFYYKDSREELVLGSIPLPSYKILFCTPRECKNRKFTFKVVHQGMRSYYFSADTQEDMLGWVRALSQSASMETDSSMHRRCSSYQDFTQIGGSSESVDLPNSPSEGETCPKLRHVSRTLSEPSHLSGGRIVTSNAEQRGRRAARQRNASPSARTPSPWGPNREGGSLPIIISPTHAETVGSLTSRGQLASRPHTPVGRVDIRPHEDTVTMSNTLYYTPVSPKIEFKSTPTTPVTERWQNVNKPSPIYGSVHHGPTGRRPLGKSYSTDVHKDLPPLPPSSRVAHGHHSQHHPQRSNLSSPKSEPPPIRPLESDADAVLTKLCGCDKLLQSLSVELSQLQIDKDSVQCALEVLRLQLEDWSNLGPRAQEEALTQKALLQEELVTIRARMCDLSMEMEVVWGQYERMESELSVFRSHLQHICNFGMPQEQSQAQRELWMMEDILAGLKVNRDHFCFLLGLQKHYMYESSGPHPGSPGSPPEILHSLPMQNVEQESPPVRPPLPKELLESIQSTNEDNGWTGSQYEWNYPADHTHGRNKSQPALLNVKAQNHGSAYRSSTKGITADTTSQSTKKMKMSEEEQMERMKRNQERMTNRKKPPLPSPAAKTQSQSLEMQKEAPFPLRVTRVVTAVLPTSLVARRVSVEDPPAEMDAPLPERVMSDLHGRVSQPSKKSRPTRPTQASADVSSEAPAKTSRTDVWEPSAGLEDERSSDIKVVEQPSSLLIADMDPNICMTPEQREAKLRRVEKIRQRVIQSAITPVKQDAHLNDTSVKQRATLDHEPSTQAKSFRTSLSYSPPDSLIPVAISQVGNKQNQRVDDVKSPIRFGSKTQHKSYSRRAGVATKIKRPPSPHHITSMTVYQRNGDEGFLGSKEGDKQELNEFDGKEDNDGNTSDVRSKWFLSTNQRLEFLPLHIPEIDICNEEASGKEDPPNCSDEGSNSTQMSSTVSQSLEKMKENHSLFYKIACDISISDTDINKNDGNSGEELVINEGVIRSSSDQTSTDSTQKLPSDTDTDKMIADTVDALRLYIQENQHEAPARDVALECDQVENGRTEESEERRLDQDKLKDRTEDQENMKTSSSSLQNDKSVSRRDSFQKTKVTVFRTSL